MSINGHLENLERKHAVLENLIELEVTRPLPDFVKITQMKRQKLRLKEQLNQYSPEAA
jgi:hypothetical protein